MVNHTINKTMISTKTSQFVIAKDETILASMKKLDANANKILFVIDENEKLIGSLTDGDIRRWILAGKQLSEKVFKVCNTKPIFIVEEYTTEAVKDIMLTKNIECIPVLSKNHTIIDVIFWLDIFHKKKKEIKKRPLNVPVVIMAGGFGTRLAPFTTILPKALIPIGNKSIVEHIIDKFLPYDVKEFHMTVNHKSNIIKSYFEDIEKTYSINIVKENKPLGTAGSLKLLKEKIDDVFIVTNCDIIIYADYAEILDFHVDSGYDITLVSSMMNYKIPYGICEIDKGGKLIEIREKPEYNFLISTGMYVLNKKILDYIPDNEFYHITHLMEEVKKQGGTVGVFPISENSWDDTGEWDEYNKTVKRLTND
ncbi:CBS domain-containing protein [Flavobacteriaceae bacterium PRS1]|nr:CBS domain-containing protein [Flavobacteriaceae bacterium PRS1]